MVLIYKILYNLFMKTYLIVSETIYNINKKIKEIINDINNIVYFNMDENSIEEILNEASYNSLFNDKKCVIVKNSKLFSNNKETNNYKNDSEKLLKYLDNENENTILIFTLLGKCDTKKKIYNILKEHSNAFIYNSMTKTDMKNELLNYVKDNKYNIEDRSLWYIINNNLSNLDICLREIDKIMLYYDKPCNINYNDVIKLTSKNYEENSFKLVDSIINKDVTSAYKSLNELKIFKVEQSVIISLLFREYKLMFYTYIYLNNKYSKEDISKKLELAPWQFDKVINNLNKYKLNEIKNEIKYLSNLDYLLKSGKMDRDMVLLQYILHLSK